MVSILDIALFILPAYIANSSPVVLGGGTPLDLGKNFSDGRRILDNGKTIRGFVLGTLAGTLVGILIHTYYVSPFFTNQQTAYAGSFLLAFGTLLGDALGSFIKRRAGVEHGKPFLLDTFLFVVVALVLVYPLTIPGMLEVWILALVVGVTLILHPTFNIIANKLGLKKVAH